jgi:hypothetical protein
MRFLRQFGAKEAMIEYILFCAETQELEERVSVLAGYITAASAVPPCLTRSRARRGEVLRNAHD